MLYSLHKQKLNAARHYDFKKEFSTIFEIYLKSFRFIYTIIGYLTHRFC
jgi:hypothetical protein